MDFSNYEPPLGRMLATDSREAWLKERSSRVTATEIAQLAKGSLTYQAQLKTEKLHGRKDFDNTYMEWGRLREPEIMKNIDQVHSTAGQWRANSQLYVAASNEAYAATPDGFAREEFGVDCVVEIKTTNIDYYNLGGLRTHAPHYYDQVQWQMFVAGVSRCLFLYELRMPVGEAVDKHAPAAEQFTPGLLGGFTIDRDDKRIAELQKIADEFLAFMFEPETVDDTWLEWHAQYLDAKKRKADAEAELAELEELLRNTLGSEDSVLETSLGKISYQWRTAKRFDSAAFKALDPDTYAKFMVEKPNSKANLSVGRKK